MKNQIKEINLLSKKAYEHLEQNNLDEVGRIINELEKIETIYSKIKLSSLVIDYGYEKKELSLVIKGIELIQLNQKDMIKSTNPSFISYLLANGYSHYYSLTKDKDLNGKNINIELKRLYKEAVQNSNDSNLRTECLVNLGNIYNNFGRHADALEYYEKALKISPTHGMALVNKSISLIEYEYLIDYHSPLIADAYNCSKDALKSNKLTYQGKEAAKKIIKHIEENYNQSWILNKKNKNKIHIKRPYSTLEELSNIFCHDNRLYLNLCNFCQKCENSIGDNIIIEEMTTQIDNKEIENNKFFVLSSYLNQIKMDFISARLNLIIYHYKELDLRFVMNNVTLINPLNYEIHDIRIQLVKDSFKKFYDILDKIAYFINRYFNLNIKTKKINFKIIWKANFKDKTLKEEIDSNDGLKALFDIYEDILYGDERKLNDIRNTLTHRVLKIKLFLDDEEDDLTEEEFFNRTIDLAKIVRNAVIYLMAMVHIEESKKNNQINGNVK